MTKLVDGLEQLSNKVLELQREINELKKLTSPKKKVKKEIIKYISPACYEELIAGYSIMDRSFNSNDNGPQTIPVTISYEIEE